MAKDETKTANVPVPKPASTNRAFPVLVIDDNEGDRRLTAIYLDQAWPFQRDLAIDFAADGAEALDKARHVRFALVVLDWKMPLLSGGEVLRRLRQNGVRTPVVVVSGLERDQIQENIESFGAGFVTKERLNADTLREAIATSLRLLGFVQPPAKASPPPPV